VAAVAGEQANSLADQVAAAAQEDQLLVEEYSAKATMGETLAAAAQAAQAAHPQEPD